jgi:hypothetical protein
MEKNLQPLRPFKLWVLQNFPFIEEDFDALTNYEMMCKIVGKLNEVVNITNEQTATFQYLSEEFTKLKNYVDEYLVGLDDVKAQIELINTTLDNIAITLNDHQEEITSLNNKIDSEINRVINIINSNYNRLKDYVDFQDNLLNEKIDNIQIGQIEIYDPTSGTIKPLQEVINNLYGLTNKDGLTASEFDALDLTATAFDAYQITAYQFDSEGKIILV